MIIGFFAMSILAALLWRLRGGAFTTLTGIDPGTDGARAIATIGLPLLVAAMAGNATPLVLAAPLMAGLMIAGWGPFQGMGLPPANMPEASWLRCLPLALGFGIDTFWHDFVGMMQAGAVCLAPSFLAGLWFGHHAWVLLIAGAGFAPAYALARLNFPTIPNFAEGQSWGEIFAGALVGAGFFVTFV